MHLLPQLNYSNTTLVKVKFKSMVDITVKEYPFKYNTC